MARQDIYLILTPDAGPFNSIRHLFEEDSIPVTSPFPTAMVGPSNEPAFVIDPKRLNFEQRAGLANLLTETYPEHSEMNADIAIKLVKKGVPILARWRLAIVGDDMFATPEMQQWGFEFNQLSNVPSINLLVSPEAAWHIISQLQVASRHPGNLGFGMKLVRQIAEDLEAGMDLSPFMKEFLAKGWNPDLDVKVE